MKTVPNQKTVVIHREKPTSNFLQIKKENWTEVNKKYGPYVLQIYLYLAGNADGYSLALSQQAALNEAGIKKTTFHKYVNLLIEEGYLVKRSGNTYDFYETPHKQEKEETGSSQEEQENSQDGNRSSPQTTNPPQENKEIDNRYTDKIDKGTDSLLSDGEQEETYPARAENTLIQRKTVKNTMEQNEKQQYPRRTAEVWMDF